MPQIQFIVRVLDISVLPQRQARTVQTVQQTVMIRQVRLLDKVVSMSVVAVQAVQPVDIPQLQFLDRFSSYPLL